MLRRLLVVPILALAATGLSALPAQAAPAADAVKGGNFGSGWEANWWHTDVKTTLSAPGQRLTAHYNGGDANQYDAMFGQSGIPLTNGTAYTLSFDASASAAKTVRVTVQLPNSATPILDKQIALATDTTKHYSYTFTSTATSAEGQITVQVGNPGGEYNVYLDTVSLISGVKGNPITMNAGFYVDPTSNPKNYVDTNTGTIRDRINASIATKPMAKWYGNWNTDVTGNVATFVDGADAADRTPTVVAYNIPGRDCGGQSSGGAGSPEGYRQWISNFAGGLGTKPAIVVLEPDAIAQMGQNECYSQKPEEVAARKALLTYATQVLKDRPNTWVYLDAANSGWYGARATEMAGLLNSSGLANVRGFSVNVSNYFTTAESVTYAGKVNAALGTTKPFVVDTSRNANGTTDQDGQPGPDWCNPPDMKLGQTAVANSGGIELQLWVKVPGDSDGVCGTSSTEAGHFDPNLAIHLIDGN